MNIDKKYAILRGLLYGYSNEKLAEDSQLSLSRVKQYIYVLCQSYGVKTRNELASKLYRKLVTDEQIENLLCEIRKGDPLNG